MKERTIRGFTLAFVLLSLISLAENDAEPVRLTRDGDQVDVVIGGRPFTTYYFGPDSPKPYLHPLTSAQGTVVTRGYPMVRDISNEDHNHPHHRATFFAHGDINGVDFWSEAEESPRTEEEKGNTPRRLPNGRTVFKNFSTMKSGHRFGALRAHFDLLGPGGKAIAQETQAYLFRGDQTTRTIDCEFIIRASQGRVKMGDTKEGTFAIRVVKALDEPAGHMLNSEHKVGEKEIWGKRANWVDYSGMVAGEKVGVAIFDHPANPKHPTYWMARGYGLFAVNPFGEHDFYNDPRRDGSLTIAKGGVMRLRYRVLIHHGDAVQANIARAYEMYAGRAKSGNAR